MSEALDYQNPDGQKVARLVDRVLIALELPAERELTSLRSGLSSIVTDWTVDRLAKSISGRPGEQRQLLQRLTRSIHQTIRLMRRVAPEYAVAVSVDEVSSTNLFLGTEDLLLRLHRRIQWFNDTYRPTKGSADVGLDEAVRALVDLFHSEGLARPRVRQGRADVPPELVSKEANAIGLLLQSSVDGLQTRTLVNKISEVMKGQPPVESHLTAIWEACDGAVDLMLTPARKDRQI